MIHLNENTIETFAIELFSKLGYEYIYAPDVAPDASAGSAQVPTNSADQRESFAQVLLLNRLQQAVSRINRSIPREAQAINYCEAYNIADGLLINFGAKSLDFKRVYNKSIVNPKIK